MGGGCRTSHSGSFVLYESQLFTLSSRCKPTSTVAAFWKPYFSFMVESCRRASLNLHTASPQSFGQNSKQMCAQKQIKPPLLPSSGRAATLYTPELPGMSFFPQLDHLMLCCEIGLGPSSVPDSGVLMVSSIEEHLRRKKNLTLSHQESRLG